MRVPPDTPYQASGRTVDAYWHVLARIRTSDGIVGFGYIVALNGALVNAVAAASRELGEQITRDYEGRELLLIGVLKGAFVLMADLSRHIRLPLEVDFMAVASYGAATKTSGVVRILKDLDHDLEGRDVLLIEDIVDSGLTLNYLLKNLRGRKPASLEVCALLKKTGIQRVHLDVKYVGFEIPPDFVVGYGLDFAERFRNVPYVGLLKPEAYADI